MDEAEAKAWLNVPRETLERLELFVGLLRSENGRQNLVSAASLDYVWSRHIADSAQLLLFSGASEGSWIDLGTGAGFPGMVVALLRSGPVTLVESRKLRVDFLIRAKNALGLAEQVDVVCANVQNMPARVFDTISARAFAPLGKLLELGERFAAPTTRWVLPKGRNAKSELEAIESLWQGDFRLEPSLTDPDAQIIVAEQVRRRERGKKRR
jgi:16S rRNA (guanine527-N7)-methyltransferase